MRHICAMIQRAGSGNDIPREIASRIARAVQPWRVVLFGSHARGNAGEDSDYDIFVEIDAEQESLRKLDQRIRTLFRDTEWRLDLHVRRRGEIERRRDDPGTLEWDVAREGKLLYADPAAASVLAPPDRVREPSPELPESVHEWLELADRDLRHCRVLQGTGDDYSPEICGLSQQSAEKQMKALLVARHVRPARTHDLTELLGVLRQNGCALPELDGDCALLTEHAVTPRYPAGLNLGEEDARVAFAAAERIAAAVRAQLPPMLH
jgi:HEPN domain-containing protein/predicted nucleotidyltransferase